MAVDTPARIAVIGAGPIGLETALYARYLGYEVDLYEAGDVAGHVRRWGHVRLFTPFRLNHSPLGVRALQAQDESYVPPDDEAYLTGREWADRYLVPLSQTDLLRDAVVTRCRVVSISRSEYLKREHQADRRDLTLRLLLRNEVGGSSDRVPGEEWTADADVVIDTTGVYGQPNWLGAGGAPAVGENACHERIRYDLPDVLGADRERYSNRHILLVGAGMSAATTVVDLNRLAEAAPETRVTWVLRKPAAATRGLTWQADDPLPQRAALVRAAGQIAAATDGPVDCLEQSWVESIRWNPATQQFDVQLAGADVRAISCDEVIGQVGYRPDREMYRELLVHECYATEGPMKLAASLVADADADCLSQRAHGADSLTNPEPDFYVLGAKSYGRRSNFLLNIGLQQIQQLFTRLSDRKALDLYQ